MNNDYTIILSSGEIYVLAGLLGYTSVFGVENNTLREWHSAVKQNVRKTVERLEKRMLILFELDGTICWQKSVDEIIRCVSCPDTACMVTYTSDSGRITETWLLSKGENTVIMNQIAADAYKLQLSDKAARDAVSVIFKGSNSSELHESIPLKKAVAIRREIDSFNHDLAEESAREYVSSEDNLDTLLDSLSGSCRFLSIQSYQRKEEYYRSSRHLILVNSGNTVLKLQLDKQDMLHFDSVSEDEIIRMFDADDSESTYI